MHQVQDIEKATQTLLQHNLNCCWNTVSDIMQTFTLSFAFKWLLSIYLSIRLFTCYVVYRAAWMVVGTMFQISYEYSHKVWHLTSCIKYSLLVKAGQTRTTLDYFSPAWRVVGPKFQMWTINIHTNFAAIKLVFFYLSICFLWQFQELCLVCLF